MKYLYILFLLISLLFISCSSSDDSADLTMNDNDMEAVLEKELQGTFVSEAHPTSGTSTVNIEKTELSFIDFKTDDGPLLEVWLSTSRTPTTADTYISLGNLKGIEGNYTYDLPTDVDFEKYDHVVIWCVDFSVSFGYAVVK